MALFGPLRQRLRRWLEARWQVPSVHWRLKALAARGFQVRRVVDVGAYHGEFIALAQTCFPGCAVIALEGAPPALQVLRDHWQQRPDVTLLPVLAGAARATLPFLLQHSNSRVVDPAEVAHHAPQDVLQVPVDTLDRVLPDGVIDLLKLDVQGHELAVLDGAVEALARTRAVLVEVSILRIGHAPDWHAVLARLEQAGFVLVDLIEPKYRPRDRALWQIDLLLLRADEPLVADRSW